MRLLPRSTPVLVLLAAALLLGASGGAVAGAMITGAQIKDNTVTTADIKNGNLAAKDLSKAARASLKGQTGKQPGIAALEFVENESPVVGAGESGFATALCPVGKRPISVTADWLGSNLPTGTRLASVGRQGFGYGFNTTASDDTLRVQVLCAAVS